MVLWQHPFRCPEMAAPYIYLTKMILLFGAGCVLLVFSVGLVFIRARAEVTWAACHFNKFYTLLFIPLLLEKVHGSVCVYRRLEVRHYNNVRVTKIDILSNLLPVNRRTVFPEVHVWPIPFHHVSFDRIQPPTFYTCQLTRPLICTLINPEIGLI